MNLAEAQNIMRGYMAPRSHAINYFAQTGFLLVSEDNLDKASYKDREADAKQELLEAIMGEVQEQHLQVLFHRSHIPTDEREDTHTGPMREHQFNIAKLMRVANFIDDHFSD